MDIDQRVAAAIGVATVDLVIIVAAATVLVFGVGQPKSTLAKTVRGLFIVAVFVVVVVAVVGVTRLVFG